MTIRDLIRRIERENWQCVRQRERIRRYMHPSKGGKITIGGDAEEESVESVTRRVLKQAGSDETSV